MEGVEMTTPGVLSQPFQRLGRRVGLRKGHEADNPAV